MKYCIITMEDGIFIAYFISTQVFLLLFKTVSIQLDGNKITASWSYQMIETISTSLHLSLIFFEPSELQNQTTEVTDMQSYNFTMDGLRSCDFSSYSALEEEIWLDKETSHV